MRLPFTRSRGRSRPRAPAQNADVAKPSVAGWYPKHGGEPGKRYWDGQGWHTAVPAAHSHGSQKLFKVAGAVAAGLLTVLGLAAIAAGFLRGDAAGPGSTASTTAAPTSSTTPTAPGYLSDKMMRDDGMYRIGGDQVDPGVWESAGPVQPGSRCSWARLSAPEDIPENAIEAGGSHAGPARARILPTYAAFMTRGCQPWRLVAR